MNARVLAPLAAALALLAPRAAARPQSLDGIWQLVPDARDAGVAQEWFRPGRFPVAEARQAKVPGNINETWPNPAAVTTPGAANLDWYRCTFEPQEAAGPDRRFYLRFGAVRYLSEAWLNGHELGLHEGGQDPFEYDVTPDLVWGRANTLILRVASPYFGGINQPVTLEAQPLVRIIDAFAQPDSSARVMHLDITLENNRGAGAAVEVTADCGLGEQRTTVSVPPGRSVRRLDLPVPEPHLWDLKDPYLYSVAVSIPGDACRFRTGFRDFRIVNGLFELNGRRILLKSTHGNWYDPIAIQGNSGDLTYLRRVMPALKRAGFNTLRLIISAALPEQLEQADELGFLVYSEHETSWQLQDPTKFGVSLNGVVRRDRNHPSLVIWGLLNETSNLAIYHRARAWLPSLRAIDPTRLVLLSSGRWDHDFRTASASNPGSPDWNVYLGGENPISPEPTGALPAGAFYNGTGDAHVYESYPASWKFVSAFCREAQKTHPFLLSEAGDGSQYDPYDEQRKLRAADAPDDTYAETWIRPAIAGLNRTWKTYGLASVYPSIETMLIDSAVEQSRQRALTFSFVRGNPRVNGYNMTSLNDCWGTGEGAMDNFYDFKPGHFHVLQEGWAPERWCLLMASQHVYAGEPVHLRVSFANEDALAAGDYPAHLDVAGRSGVIWRTPVTVRIAPGPDAPLAYLVFDQDVTLPPVPAGDYALEAGLDGRPNAAAGSVAFTLSRRDALPRLTGAITVAGLSPAARALLQSAGATLRDYAPDQHFDHEAILVGERFSESAADWRRLYERIAQGAHAVFLSPAVFAATRGARPEPLQWLALGRRGTLVDETEWLYHKAIIARDSAAFSGLQIRLMTPEYYGQILAHAPYFEGIDPPDQVAAVAVRCMADGAAPLVYHDGVELGTYRLAAGRFTINGLDILGNLGSPAADRLLLNLAQQAAGDAAALSPLPAGCEAGLEALGLVDGS